VSGLLGYRFGGLFWKDPEDENETGSERWYDGGWFYICLLLIIYNIIERSALEDIKEPLLGFISHHIIYFTSYLILGEEAVSFLNLDDEELLDNNNDNLDDNLDDGRLNGNHIN